MTDKQAATPEYLENLAFGILESASDYNSGRAALLDAYNTYQWTDDAQAQDVLEYYGQALKFRDRDKSRFPDVEELAPVPFSKVSEVVADPVEAYNVWEQQNKELLETNQVSPEYRIIKQQLLTDITDTAGARRQEIKGKGAGVQDLAANLALGFTSGIEPIVNTAAQALGVEDFQLSDAIQEYTNPEKNAGYKEDGEYSSGALSSGLAQVTGNVAGYAAAAGAGALVAGPAAPIGAAIGAVTYGLTQAVDSIATRYADTIKRTGDETRAANAATVEGASQTLQLTGDRLIIGRVLGRALGKTADTVGNELLRNVITESTSEGAGQFVSNVAENIQEDRGLFEDATRGVGRSAFLGAVGGGEATGLGVAVQRIRPVAKTDKRIKEIEETGAPITPVVVNKIGEPSPVTVEPLVREADEIMPADTTQAVEVENVDTLEDIDTAPITVTQEDVKAVTADKPVAFIDESGNEYVQVSPGKFSIKGGVALDNTFFANEEQFKAVANAIEDGKTVTAGETNSLRVRNEDGTSSVLVDNLKSDYSEGDFTINVSNERKPTKDAIETTVHLGRRIKTVVSDRSMGAAGTVIEEQKESMYSYRLRQNAGLLPKEMSDVGKEGIFYTPITIAQADSNILPVMRGFNSAQDVLDYMNDQAVLPELKTRVGVLLHNKLEQDMVAATAAGDLAELNRLKELFTAVAPAISAAGTSTGRAMRFTQGKTNTDLIMRAADNVNETLTTKLSEAAKELGVTAEEVAASDTKLRELTEQNAQLQARITELETTPYENPEIAAKRLVVTELENEARVIVDEDLTSISEEEDTLRTAITTITTDSAKQKSQDIAAIQNELAKASKELAETAADASVIKTVSKEESATLEAEIAEAAKTSETAVNKELVKAVKEERDSLQNTGAVELARAQDKLTKATDKLRTTVADLKPKIAAIANDQKKAEFAGEDTTDLQNKRVKLEAKLAEASDRVEKAKQNLAATEAGIRAEREANAEVEALLDDLEGGVEIQVRPVGKKRVVSVKTKRNGTDITKLFNNKRSSALRPLTTLAQGVNNLANVLSDTAAARKGNTSKINELRRKIDGYRKTLDSARSADAISPANRRKIEAAKKRLDELSKVKTNVTVENAIPKGKKKTYDQYKKDIDEAKGKKVVNPELAAAEEELRNIEKARLKAEKLAKKKAEAVAAAQAEAKELSGVVTKIQRLEALLNNELLVESEKKGIEAEIIELRSSLTKSPGIKFDLYRQYLGNLIGSGINAVISLTGTVAEPAVVLFQNAFMDAWYTARVLGGGDYKIPTINFLKGFLDYRMLKRGGKGARYVLTDGIRYSPVYNREEIGPPSVVKAIGELLKNDNVQAIGELLKNDNVQMAAEDFINYTKQVSPDAYTSKMMKIIVPLIKKSNLVAGSMLRILVASEMPGLLLAQRGYERLEMTRRYNKRIMNDAEFEQYVSNSEARWTQAEAETASAAAQLAEAGVEMSPARMYAATMERYMKSGDQSISMVAYKKAAMVGLNVPAQGYIGLLTSTLEGMAKYAAGKTSLGKVAPYITALGNSVGVLAGRILDTAGLGALGTIGGKELNRTDLEIMMARSATLTAMSAFGVWAAFAASMQDVPEEDRWFDIIHMYSKDKTKRDTYIQNGGMINAFKFGNLYVPFGETIFAGVFGAMGAHMDRMRDGEEFDADSLTDLMFATTSMMFNSVKVIEDLPMLQTVGNAYEAMKAFFSSGGDVEKVPAIVKAIANPVKSFVLPTSFMRYISRYTDNPVDLKKDIASAFFEGIPGLQSGFGKPALNLFGEPMSPDKYQNFSTVHRLFSTAGDDIDMRWLSDNGYDVPGISNMQFAKDVKEAYKKQNGEDIRYRDHIHKYNVYRMSAPELRDLVADFRNVYKSHARNETVQKQLREKWNKITSRNAVTYLRNEGLLPR